MQVLIALLVLIAILSPFALFFYLLKKDLRGDLAAGRVQRGSEREFPVGVPLLERRFDLDVEAARPRELAEIFEDIDVGPEGAIEGLRDAVEETVREGERPSPTYEVLSALWWTLGLVHYEKLDDSDTALACFDVADAASDHETWTRTDVVDALRRVNSELEIDYDGPSPGPSDLAHGAADVL